ncbi:uncharacterized protein BXZ73DRAFT_108637 [Epithele typhae]|uniref:uncharacterized protein n=1 Tax=Epithele typhae TaxID=378194 RepID=UPI002007F526|nr:uncharacterized protein BXZ73DRAFT_108637 [Epithele typhae]KAH9910684.1 hypothetical protein BXZ73DRAFT_108637 [Epithele typhae]
MPAFERNPTNLEHHGVTLPDGRSSSYRQAKENIAASCLFQQVAGDNRAQVSTVLGTTLDLISREKCSGLSPEEDAKEMLEDYPGVFLHPRSISIGSIAAYRPPHTLQIVPRMLYEVTHRDLGMCLFLPRFSCYFLSQPEPPTLFGVTSSTPLLVAPIGY